MKVLLVEDDFAMRRLLRDALHRAGHRVLERPDGSEAVAVAEREEPDAMILDKEMPGPNGLDILSLLRSRVPTLPVIFVTAFGGPHVAAEARRRGAYRYVEKPFRLGAILDTLAAIERDRLRGGPGGTAAERA
jgi:two-component system, NtrC family, response regulator AtoC